MSDTVSTSLALEGLRADRDALVSLAVGFSSEQWASASGCEGWDTKDLVSHLASTFWSVVDGTAGPDTAGLGFEEAVAVKVDSRRLMTPADILADYEEVSLRALDILPTVAGLDLEVPFGESESYPAALLPAAFCFDHYTHIRADLFAPRGSLIGEPPPSDELRLTPTLDWIEAAIPKQNPTLVGSLPGQIDLIVTETSSRTISIGTGGAIASIESDGPSLVRWITQRAAWEDLDVKAEGTSDALESARSLKVY